MDQHTFSALLEKYLNDDLSQEELSRLLDSLQDENLRRQWESAIGGMLANPQLHGLSDRAQMDRVRKAILRKPLYRRLLPYAAAAAVLFLAAAGLFYMNVTPTVKPLMPTAQQAPAVLPGGNKAMLTLADGSQITLDSAGNGAIASQGNVQVIKLNNGQLAYQANGAKQAAGYNTLVTPRGGQYRIQLPDGSEVWLNAASSLRFPTVFDGPEREVQLKGEAYFEIAQNSQQPFRVKVDDMTVQVLGTHFNVMAYADEQHVRTTLLQGAVKVMQGSSSLHLRPGQQAEARGTQALQLREGVNLEQVVAWKNGYFQFNHEPLEGVLRQIGRWYDAEIVYEGKVPDREFGGQISRNSSITEVLKMLELTNVRFRVEGKRIVVTQ
ncbi:FecR domain-containing protein [Chitinophaga horti]|uniref:FecR domain-containing protein n=1 Tax=Chitinophaga horti TaxID=2920382 RepID=A0ABY6J3A2_9BACT|nr:FecR family protein [Chitinophaga horti]UYQ94140.1 FecR domain-containing protein [Chitinophaga horti]